jgi:hypothetical protein
MTGVQFSLILRGARAHYPISDDYEQKYLPGPAWWSSQQEHVTRWLDELDGPGAYDRKTRELGARHGYNHFACAPGLLWIAEALGEDLSVVQRAADTAAGIGRGGTQCAAIRQVIPWQRILTLAQLRMNVKLSLWARMINRVTFNSTAS